ncbi:hypothetical protein AAVH_12367 [Aphelenchoides avenae]|nr:hypothetical protein AAVH_12367 [Aphelenchus avenae]
MPQHSISTIALRPPPFRLQHRTGGGTPTLSASTALATRGRPASTSSFRVVASSGVPGGLHGVPPPSSAPPVSPMPTAAEQLQRASVLVASSGLPSQNAQTSFATANRTLYHSGSVQAPSHNATATGDYYAWPPSRRTSSTVFARRGTTLPHHSSQPELGDRTSSKLTLDEDILYDILHAFE